MSKASAVQHSEIQSSFSSLDVAKITGVSLRQLQWWDEQGVVTPLQQGHRRLYKMHEVVEVSLITELRRKGISLQKIRKVLSHLQREYGSKLFQPNSNGSDLHLLTDGENVYLEDSDRGIVNILKESNQPIISVCISDQIAHLTSRAGLRKPVKRETGVAAPSRVRKAS